MDIKSINSYSGYKDTGICSNLRFYHLFFRSKRFIGIIIKENSYFSNFPGRLFYIPESILCGNEAVQTAKEVLSCSVPAQRF